MAAVADSLGWQVTGLPLSDGGEGLLEACATVCPEEVETVVTGPDGSAVTARWRVGDGMAVVESALASGLVLAGGAEANDPMAATSRGTGELLVAAAARVGPGGTDGRVEQPVGPGGRSEVQPVAGPQGPRAHPGQQVGRARPQDGRRLEPTRHRQVGPEGTPEPSHHHLLPVGHGYDGPGADGVAVHLHPEMAAGRCHHGQVGRTGEAEPWS